VSIGRRLSKLYGEERGARILPRLKSLIQRAGGGTLPPARPLTHKSATLIAYGDQVRDGSRPPLAVLERLLNARLRGLLDRVHLLPFFPYSSDDGFSVIDYKQVDPKLGGWEDVRRLGAAFGLMFDAVINHASAL